MDTDLLVIGGGLAGLAAAQRARRGGANVRLLEAGERTGGVVGSFAVEHDGDTYRFETGPHSVPSTARHVTAAIERLGLNDRVVTSTASAQKRYLLWRGALRALPASPPGLLRTKLVSWRTKLRFLGESGRAWSPPPGDAEPTLHDLVRERFGEDAATRVAGAFVRGVYAGEAKNLGARSAFPRLWAGLLEHRSILRFLKASRAKGGGLSRATLLSFEHGMGELPEGFARALGDTIELNAPVAHLDRDADGFTATLGDGTRRRGRAVVLAVPLPVALELVAPLATDDATRAALDAIRPTRANGVRLVHLGFARRPDAWPDGFGFLVPPDEASERGVRLLGTLVPSNVFAGRAPDAGATAACFYRLDAATAAESHDDTAAVARRELAGALGLGADALVPAITRVLDWPGAVGGIPEYAPGHDRRVAALEEALASTAGNLVLAGSYTHGVSVDDVLAQGERAAERLLETSLAPRATGRANRP